MRLPDGHPLRQASRRPRLHGGNNGTPVSQFVLKYGTTDVRPGRPSGTVMSERGVTVYDTRVADDYAPEVLQAWLDRVRQISDLARVKEALDQGIRNATVCARHWASHGCLLPVGHQGDHVCCCDCEPGKHGDLRTEVDPDDGEEFEWVCNGRAAQDADIHFY